MSIFISYARADRPAVEALSRDLERAHHDVWMDNELAGGQIWWDTILRSIRECDLYVFVLSPDSLTSRACKAEFEYALALRRPLMPVLVRDVAIQFAHPAIGNTHIVDYRVRSVESGIALVSAIARLPAAPALPDPLPPQPATPMSYMNHLREQVEAPFLTFQQQSHLLVDLKEYLGSDEGERRLAMDLLMGLRHRRDVAEHIGREIDQITRASAWAPPVEQPDNHPPPRQPTPVGFSNASPMAGNRSGPSNDLGSGYPGPSPGSSQPAVAVPHPQATTVLVLGIAGLLLCGIAGIFAITMGNTALKQIDANPQAYSNRSTVNTGRVLGWCAIGLWVLYLIVYAAILSQGTS